jgi:hypothetical protein
MSLATAKPQPLTTIAGGINRLRTKGGASRDALYDLVNGYVTMSNTVVPRPGTDRNADLTMGGEVPAGSTKGLVGFEGGFYVFTSVNPPPNTPDNYSAVLLVHPAVNSVTTQTGSADSEILSGSGVVAISGEYWGETTGTGLNNRANGSSPTYGTMTPAILTGAPVLFLGDVTFGTHYLMLVMPPGTAQDFFTTMELTLSGGSTNTYEAGAATHYYSNGEPLGEALTGFPANCCCWLWETSNVDFDEGESTAVEFDGLNYTGNAPIALKEIHFAAPFLGFLYVVAEFEPDQSGLGSIFHYWVQLNEDTAPWAANTDHSIGDIVIPTSGYDGLFYVASRATQPNPVWTPTTLEAEGNIVEPTVPNGFEYTCISTEGSNPVTGSSEPTWPTADGATVSEFTSLSVDQSISPSSAPQPAVNTPDPATVSKYSNLAGGL